MLIRFACAASVFGLSCRIAAEPAAAVLTPVHWAVEAPAKLPFHPRATFELTVSAKIESGWHINSLEEPDGGPAPTQIGLAESDPLTLLSVNEPQPRMVPAPALHQATGVFMNAVAFTLRLRMPPNSLPPGSVSHILVRYQSCNDHVCLPPRTEKIPLPLTNRVK